MQTRSRSASLTEATAPQARPDVTDPSEDQPNLDASNMEAAEKVTIDPPSDQTSPEKMFFMSLAKPAKNGDESPSDADKTNLPIDKVKQELVVPLIFNDRPPEFPPDAAAPRQHQGVDAEPSAVVGRRLVQRRGH